MSPLKDWLLLFRERGSQVGKIRSYTVRQQTAPADYLRPQRWNWDILLRPLDERLRKSVRETLDTTRLVGLRYFWLDGLFSTISDNFYVTFIPLFALAYKASNGTIGVMTAVTNLLGTVALFPGARKVESLGQRKPLIVATGGGIGRLVLIVLVVLPFFVRSPGPGIVVVIAVSAIRAFMGNFCNPAWTSMTADLVPPTMRARYFTSRNQIMGVAALVVSPLAGWIINVGNAGARDPYFGYQLIFFFALLFGMVSTFCFNRIPEPAAQSPIIRKHQRGDLRRAIRNRPDFVWFVVSAFVWNLAIQMSGPFFNVYMMTGLNAPASMVGLAAGVTSFATLFGQHIFGSLIDRKGNLWVQRVSGGIIPIMPLLWIVVRDPWEVMLINVVAGFAWAGYNMSNFNLLLDLTPEDQRARAVALYQTVVFSSAVIGPALGGYLADLSGFFLVFAVSAAGRAAGIGLFYWKVKATVQGKSTR